MISAAASASGCYFIIDRKQDMFFILMQQIPSQRQRIQTALKKLIYEAMENCGFCARAVPLPCGER